LDPGERVRATVGIRRRSLSWWDAGPSRWRAASGEVEIEVGASSRDVRLRGRVTIPE
jgi:beta-glucosidase